MVPIGNNSDLRLWRFAIEFTVGCYVIAHTLPRVVQFWLAAQIRRAAIRSRRTSLKERIDARDASTCGYSRSRTVFYVRSALSSNALTGSVMSLKQSKRSCCRIATRSGERSSARDAA